MCGGSAASGSAFREGKQISGLLLTSERRFLSSLALQSWDGGPWKPFKRASVRTSGATSADHTEASTKPIQASAGSSNPVASTSFRKKPFGDNVEGLSYFRDERYAVQCQLPLKTVKITSQLDYRNSSDL
jgi:hypothetical protein